MPKESKEKSASTESRELHERLEVLEDTLRATLNILEDFDEEKAKLKLVHRATINLLEDFNEERHKFQLIQKATLNLLEDVNEERNKLDDTQRALINMLEDIEIERAKAEQTKSLLESVNKELEAFSYSVSHDLQAPLRAISGFAQAVVEDYSPLLDDEGKRYLRLIRDNAHKMGQLISDLLAFSRIGRQQMTETEIDIESLAKEVWEELAAQIPERKIEFAVQAAPPAHGDKAMIRQVLVNLFANAIKFTRPKEKALIEFGYLPDSDPDSGKVASKDSSKVISKNVGTCTYYVKDNGVGFDMQYADKLFRVFQRLHSVVEFEGTGVGLALVYRIITRHGGCVWAEGKGGQGAVFFFTLPEGLKK